MIFSDFKDKVGQPFYLKLKNDDKEHLLELVIFGDTYVTFLKRQGTLEIRFDLSEDDLPHYEITQHGRND